MKPNQDGPMAMNESAQRSWKRTTERLEELEAALIIQVFTNATRPSAGNPPQVIYNSDDGNLNIDNGTNWILPDGTVT